MKIVLTFARTILSYCILGVLGLLVVIPCLLTACLPERVRFNKLYYLITDFFFKATVWASFMPVTVTGKENIPQGPVVFAANHQSSFDIPLLGSLANGYPNVWLFLKRYAHVPIFGFIARRMNVVVDVSGIRKAIRSISEGIDRVKGKNRHLMIFPEGGRATDDRVRDFFYGFAIIAKEIQRPVVPVMMFNVNRVYPPGSFLIHYYPIKIVIGKPFVFNTDESLDDFVERVHAWFVGQTQTAG